MAPLSCCPAGKCLEYYHGRRQRGSCGYHARGVRYRAGGSAYGSLQVRRRDRAGRRKCAIYCDELPRTEPRRIRHDDPQFLGRIEGSRGYARPRGGHA